jgi:hypothetical protein
MVRYVNNQHLMYIWKIVTSLGIEVSRWFQLFWNALSKPFSVVYNMPCYLGHGIIFKLLIP